MYLRYNQPVLFFVLRFYSGIFVYLVMEENKNKQKWGIPHEHVVARNFDDACIMNSRLMTILENQGKILALLTNKDIKEVREQSEVMLEHHYNSAKEELSEWLNSYNKQP